MLARDLERPPNDAGGRVSFHQFQLPIESIFGPHVITIQKRHPFAPGTLDASVARSCRATISLINIFKIGTPSSDQRSRVIG